MPIPNGEISTSEIWIQKPEEPKEEKTDKKKEEEK
jgi:hypothetical protein